jgi:hypothetical protein
MKVELRGNARIAPVLFFLAACCGPATPARSGAATEDAKDAQGVRPMTALVPAPQFDAAVRLVVRDDAAWAEVWAPRPPVDFAKEMVLVASLGMRRTGGFAATIARADLAGGVLRVEVVEKRPGAGCMTTQSLTYPVALARVARHDGAVEFADRVVVSGCR